MDKLMMEISQQAIEKVFSFIKGIDASVTYEDNFDYSKGIKGAEVSYTPETIEELASELELKIISQSHIANLEAQNKELRNALQSVVNYEDRGRKNGEPRISDHWYNICKKALKEDKQYG